MASPQKASGIVAIVPMKPLAQGKTRLSRQLTLPQRAAVGSNLLRRVLRAINGPFPGQPKDSLVEGTWVVGGDPDIMEVARQEGAEWFQEEGSDINETLGLSFQRAFDSGKAALFLPGDLPFLKPSDLYGLLGASGYLKNITLAPARQGGGTNAILVVPGLPEPFYPRLGPNSFSRHLAQAASLGLSVSIFYSSGLGFDLDTFEDFKAYEYMEPGLIRKLTESKISE